VGQLEEIGDRWVRGVIERTLRRWRAMGDTEIAAACRAALRRM